MEKGFIIFLTATGWPVNWSLAELSRVNRLKADVEEGSTHHTKPKAPMPTGCRSVYLIVGQSSLDPVRSQGPNIPTSDLESRSEDLGPHELGHLVQRMEVYDSTRSTAREAKLARKMVRS